MSEPTRLPPSGAPSLLGARTPAATAAALAVRLQIGMQVELSLSRSIAPDVIETRLRPLGSSAAWSQGIQARLTSPMLADPLQTSAVGERSAPGGAGPTRRAEVVATSPALVLRLVSTTPESSPPRPNQTVAAGSREWLGQQFRQHWPESRPLAATLERIAARLANGSDVSTGTASTPAPQPVAAGSRTDTLSVVSLQRAVDTLIGQLATPVELTDPEQLAVAVGRSGLWLEAQLAQVALAPTQSDPPTLDLKAQLLVLAQRIRLQGANAPGTPSGDQPTTGHRAGSPTRQPPPAAQAGAPSERFSPSAGTEPRPGAMPASTGPGAQRATAPAPVLEAPPATDNEPPGEARVVEQHDSRTASLAREVEGMLKQVVTKQLQSLDSPAGQTQWLLELPFRTPSGVLALEADIRREGSREDQEHVAWSMRLRLDLPKLGPLNILLTLRDDRLNAGFQAAVAEGAQQIGQHLSELRARLEAREITVAGLHAGHRPLDPPAAPFADPLVREQA